MNAHGTLGFLLVLSAVFCGSALLLRARLRRKVKVLILTGLWLRVTGALFYLYLIGSYYGGGDYLLYFTEGQRYAELLASSDFDAAIAPWLQPGWWGTYFVVRVTGILLSVIGPTLPGAFIVFAVGGYIGILALALAFRRSFPAIPLERYLAWIVLFPSLWFWPAALGKDAVVLCGIGLAALGFVGRRGRPNLFCLAAGLFLVFAIRPQVAAVVAFALMLSHWLGAVRSMSFVRAVQGGVLVVAGIGVLVLSSGALQTELFSPDAVGSYLESRAEVSSIGGSALEFDNGGGVSPWVAPVNVLMRPFPWEVRGVTALIAALEVVFIWGMGWRRRREIRAFVRTHRGDRLFWMAIVFVGMYTLALGMSLGNVGIIARQRVHLFPFIFMFFAGVLPQKGLQVAVSARVSRSPPAVV